MKKKLSLKTIFLFLLLISVIVLFVQCSKKKEGNQPVVSGSKTGPHSDSLAFGDTKWISNGLMGKIYLLPENTAKLPLFDTMKAAGILYTHTLNIPNRSWETGFPGVPNRFEWFGIEYKGNFRAKEPRHYHFRLLSDDGSRLFIDGKLLIDNDGLHSASSATGEADINGSDHSITVQYFQGPRYYIALQLFAALDKEEEQIFPGTNFILSTPEKSHFLLYIIIGALAIIILIAFYLYIRKRNAAGPSK